MATSSSMKESADAAAAAADRIKTATLNAAKGLSRAQAERAAAAAARNVNAYGQKEEGPSRWQERKEAKRQMYLMSTEKAVKLGVRKDKKSSRHRVGNDMSQQCQKCLETGHWTFDCKNERVYVSRPSRTQQLKNPKLRPRQSVMQSPTLLPTGSPEGILKSVMADRETHVRKSDMRTRKRRRCKDSDNDSDESASPPDTEPPSSEESPSITNSSSGTYSSSTNSTPSRTSSSSRKSSNSSISIPTPPDSDEDTTRPRDCLGSEVEYRGLTTEDARRKGRMKLRRKMTRTKLMRRKRRRKNKKSNKK